MPEQTTDIYDWVLQNLQVNFNAFDVGGTGIDQCDATFGYLNVTGSQSGSLQYCNYNPPASLVVMRGANSNINFNFYSGNYVPSAGHGFDISYSVG